MRGGRERGMEGRKEKRWRFDSVHRRVVQIRENLGFELRAFFPPHLISFLFH